MDLKQRKYITNTNQLPGFWNAAEFKSRWNNGAGDQVISGAVGMADMIGNAAAQSSPLNRYGDFIGKYGTSTNSIDGVGYQQYNDIDTNAEEERMSQQRDAALTSSATAGMGAGAGIGAGIGSALAAAGAGSAFGWLGGPVGALIGLGIGGLIGGIFGNKSKNKEREQMRIAQIKQNNANEEARTSALTTSLQQKQANQFGDTRTQSLYSAATGSEGVNPVTNETYDKFLTHTASGKKYAKQNAWVDDGEILVNGNKEHVVKGNPRETDGERAHLTKNTKIVSNDKRMLFPGTNMTFAEVYPYAKVGGWKNELFDIQRQTREENEMKNGLITARHGLECLPTFWSGYENLLANGLGLITSLKDYKDAMSEDVQNVNLTPYNKYEGAVSNIMGGRRANVYPIMQDLLNQDARTRRAINQSGGLSIGQRTAANIANSMNTRTARAKALLDVQNLNNQYAKENAEMLNQIGTSLMGANMDAQRFNTQMNAAAHNAKVQQVNMAKRNALDYITQYFKSDWERKQFNENMDLYRQKLDIDRRKAGIGTTSNQPQTSKSKPVEKTKQFIFGPTGQIHNQYKFPEWPLTVDLPQDNIFTKYLR